MLHIKLFMRILPVALIAFILVGCAQQGSAIAKISGALPATTGVVTTPIATTGCGRKPPIVPGTSSAMAITSGGIRRTFRYHIPSSYNANRPASLVFAMHGHGGTAAGMESYTGYSLLADRQNFLVIYPQGLVGPDKQTGWATYRPDTAHVDDVLFFSDLLSFAQHQFCVDAGRVYATGMSNGGGMTNVLACRLAGRIAAFAAISPAIYPLPNGCHPSRPVPFLDIHGTADSIVPYTGGSRHHFPPVMQFMRDWARRNGCASTSTIFFQRKNITAFVWHACRDGVQVQHYRISGGSHAWPGTPTGTISATILGWQFFQRYRLS